MNRTLERVGGRSRLSRTGSALMAILMLSACGGDGPSNRFYSLGTGGTGGVYYPMGGAIASRLSIRDSLGQYTAEVTGGSVENVNRVMAGEMDLGFAMGNTIYQAFHGQGDFEGQASPDLRVVAALYPNRIHVLVGRGSRVQGIEEFAGLRVSVGSAGSGTEQNSRDILAAYGLTYDDVDVRYLSFAETSAALRDGAIDAAFISVGYPAGAVLEATTTGGARVIPVSGPGAEALLAEYPYYDRSVIPGGVYPGVDTDLPTVAVLNWLMGRADLDPSVVRTLLNILREDVVPLEAVHEMVKQIDLSALERSPIPVHSETEAWLREGGD